MSHDALLRSRRTIIALMGCAAGLLVACGELPTSPARGVQQPPRAAPSAQQIVSGPSSDSLISTLAHHWATLGYPEYLDRYTTYLAVTRPGGAGRTAHSTDRGPTAPAVMNTLEDTPASATISNPWEIIIFGGPAFSGQAPLSTVAGGEMDFVGDMGSINVSFSLTPNGPGGRSYGPVTALVANSGGELVNCADVVFSVCRDHHQSGSVTLQNAPWCGVESTGGTATFAAWYVPVNLGGTWGYLSGSVSASPQQGLTTTTAPMDHKARACNPPTPRIGATGSDGSGSNGGSLTVAMGATDPSPVSVDLDGSGTEETDFPISSFSWSADGMYLGSDEFASLDVSSSTSATLTVTDDEGLAASASLAIDVSLYCDDPYASNFGEDGDCNYDPPAYCDDPYADNYGAPGDCTYDGYDPGYGDPGSGWWDDPCVDVFSDDPSCWGDEEAMMSIAPLPGTPPASNGRGGTQSGRRDPIFVVLADHWSDPEAIAMVGRFRHRGRMVDAIYLPAGKPTGTAWMAALRALEHDRIASRDTKSSRRLIRLGSDGAVSVRSPGGRVRSLAPWKTASRPVQTAVQRAFARGVLAKLQQAPAKQTKNLGSVRAIKYSRT